MGGAQLTLFQCQMQIINKTKDTVLAENFELCDTFLKQVRGLMFRRRIVPLVFVNDEEKKISIHSWFCFGEIDLIFLNKYYEVVELKQGWKPWRIHYPMGKSMFLIELPKGTINRTETHIGDVINFKTGKESDQSDLSIQTDRQF